MLFGQLNIFPTVQLRPASCAADVTGATNSAQARALHCIAVGQSAIQLPKACVSWTAAIGFSSSFSLFPLIFLFFLAFFPLEWDSGVSPPPLAFFRKGAGRDGGKGGGAMEGKRAKSDAFVGWCVGVDDPVLLLFVPRHPERAVRPQSQEPPGPVRPARPLEHGQGPPACRHLHHR